MCIALAFPICMESVKVKVTLHTSYLPFCPTNLTEKVDKLQRQIHVNAMNFATKMAYLFISDKNKN